MFNQSALRWLFTKEQIDNSPSIRDGFKPTDELLQRQFSAVFIHDLGAKLKAPQICINTAIIFMHRFFMIHSFKKFNRNIVAAACLFFACKVEEHPRPLRQIIDGVQQLKDRNHQPMNPNSEEFKKHSEEIVSHESCLVQTLGFNVHIKQSHTVIIKTIHMIKAPRDLAQTAYHIANNSLKITNFCIRFSYDKIACFCIYLACKWTALKIPTSNEGREWFEYVNPDVTINQLDDITEEYLQAFDRCSPELKKKLTNDYTKTQDDDKKIDKPVNNTNNGTAIVQGSAQTAQAPVAAAVHHTKTEATLNGSSHQYQQYHQSQNQRMPPTAATTTVTNAQSTTTSSHKPIQIKQEPLMSNASKTQTQQNPSNQIVHKQQQYSSNSNYHHQQPKHHHHPPQQNNNETSGVLRKSSTLSDLGKISSQQQQSQSPNVTIKQEKLPPHNHVPSQSATVSTAAYLKSQNNHNSNKMSNDVHFSAADQQQQKRSTPTNSTTTTTATNSSNSPTIQQVKRTHDDLNNSVPNKMPKYIAEKSVS